MAKYNFCENLAGLSISKDSDVCIKEWTVVYKGTTDNNSDEENRCICNRVVKNYFVLINNVNNNHIKMGSGCIKKLNDNNNNKIDTNPKSIKKNIIKLFEIGYYSQIENLNEYTEDILIDYLSSKDDKIRYIHGIIDIYKDNKNLYNKIEQILMDSIALIDKKFKYMRDIIDIYKDKKNLYKKIETILIKHTREKTTIREIEYYIHIYEDNTDLHNKIKNILDFKKKAYDRYRQKEFLEQQAQIKLEAQINEKNEKMKEEEIKNKERERKKAEEIKNKEREGKKAEEIKNKERERKKAEDIKICNNDIRNFFKPI